MATIILAAAGAAAGASFGGGVIGVGSALVGRAVGATLGRVVDQSVLGTGSDPVDVGRVDRLRLTGAGEGHPIARIFGRMRIGAQVIWASPFKEHVDTTGGGGKGAPASPEVRHYSYSISVALGLCEGVIGRVGRIWADGREADRTTLDLRVYEGRADQHPDPVIEAFEGVGNVPGYRGLAYVVIENLDLTPYGNRLPQFTFEVIRPGQEDDSPELTDMSRQVRAVALMPGTGEYALATTPVRIDLGPGEGAYQNVNTPSGRTDFAVSLDALTGELPLCGSTSLIVSWFGDDLRCGRCTIAPKVEQKVHDGVEMAWRAGGIGREQASEVPRRDGSVVYGGTPADASVIEAIQALKAAGQAVMFYPFILMEQLDGNALPDPYGRKEQPALPWRGRITLDQAPGTLGSEDGSEDAETAVSAFFGSADVGDFEADAANRTVSYIGPAAWRYRRFILHYAHICRLAGGVDAFCIGSEMRGLTSIRGTHGFPAVDELIRLAADVRSILGSETKISYAADWSEYFGHHPQDGSGDVHFHLDPLWADQNIDFIGIDNYMPLSDWRAEEDHADAEYRSIYNLDYLKKNVMGGEGYDWFYATPDHARDQIRTPITDGSYGEPWVYRYKDLLSWWSRPHHGRTNGKRDGEASPWIPKSKPIWFTELGCAAIDKGTNQPNKFLDPKSSESSLPRYSDGRRDDYMQLQYLRAMHEFWRNPEVNPVSSLYGGPMVDMSRAHVWAWDARPYPQFPGNPEIWDDAANYARGHWITGRSSNRALASVVREVCIRSGVDALELGRLHGVLRGYQVNDLGDARQALQPLMLGFGFDAIERDGRLLFQSRDGRVAARLDEALVALNGDLDGDVVSIRTPEAERVGRLKLNYVGADNDFEIRSAEAVFPGDRAIGVSQSELPILMTGGEARATTERWLAETRIARDRLRFALPPSMLGIGAGDVVEIAGGRFRIDHVDQADGQLIDAVRVEPEIYEPSLAVEDHVRVRRYTAPTPPEVLFMDLPILTPDDIPHAPYVAATQRPWAGAVNIFSAPEDAGYRLDTTLAGPSVIGVTESALGAALPDRPDRGEPLRIRFVRGDLESISDAALHAGGNAMAIGLPDADHWEVLQFRDARLVGPRTYEVAYRLRGQLGTDAIMPPNWPAGSRVVLLGANLKQIGVKATERGLEKFYRVGPASKPISDPSYRLHRREFEAAGLRPFAPVHLRASRNEGGIELSWIRRTRLDGDSWSGIDVPLGEDRESYTLRISKDGHVIRTETVDAPHWSYSPEMRKSDGVTRPFVVEVAQNSISVGPGPFRRIVID
ncbi:glycoside hydrolase/phage tail family protein [Palleronia sp. LCG004]|uniref:baseplate multidomain protein megatron n=1 Tax=Palleronia sp. LCG004 TaxID=3079304 RepID=UPI00294349F5|nr:glycoside hydrolase/phage tail family protein [Palleronia sp. LCG004]WOI55004.1 glycoside hydrolase/phage tail family protein [Palleronia sp. LCG004]